jgi:hypothetical protein
MCACPLTVLAFLGHTCAVTLCTPACLSNLRQSLLLSPTPSSTYLVDRRHVGSAGLRGAALAAVRALALGGKVTRRIKFGACSVTYLLERVSAAVTMILSAPHTRRANAHCHTQSSSRTVAMLTFRPHGTHYTVKKAAQRVTSKSPTTNLLCTISRPGCHYTSYNTNTTTHNPQHHSPRAAP